MIYPCVQEDIERSRDKWPATNLLPRVPEDVPSIDINISDIKSKTGLSSVHISRVLSGKAIPSLPVARKIASALGVSIEELDTYIESRPNIIYNGGKKIIDETTMDKIRQCKGTMSCRRASTMFGVSRTTISNIWKSI